MMRHFAGALFFVLCSATAIAQVQETPANIIAAHLRLQGYKCDAPQSAKRDAKASRPGEAVWLISCESSRYKVRLIPNMADVIEPY